VWKLVCGSVRAYTQGTNRGLCIFDLGSTRSMKSRSDFEEGKILYWEVAKPKEVREAA